MAESVKKDLKNSTQVPSSSVSCMVHMPPFILQVLKSQIPALHYEHRYSIVKICSLLNIKKTLADKTLHHHCAFGIVFDLHAWQWGVWPCHLTTTDHSFIHALLNQNHTMYLDEIQEQFISCHSVKAAITTLFCTLWQLHCTHKEVFSKALEHNKCDWAIFMNWIAELVPNPDMLMFSDEVHKDERTSNRCMGWSWQSCRCIQRKCFCEARDSPFLLSLFSTALLKAPLKVKCFMSSHTNWWCVYVFPFVCTLMKGSPDTAD